MYRRYTQVNQMGVSHSQTRRNRIKNVLIFLLIAALIAGAVIAIPLFQRANEQRELWIRRIQNEASEAVNQAPALSRNAGADSAAILARIRSNLYAIRVINDLSMAQDGVTGRFLEDETMATLQSSVDNYLSYLTRGMDTGEYQTNLQNNLNALQAQVSDLK